MATLRNLGFYARLSRRVFSSGHRLFYPFSRKCDPSALSPLTCPCPIPISSTPLAFKTRPNTLVSALCTLHLRLHPSYFQFQTPSLLLPVPSTTSWLLTQYVTSCQPWLPVPVFFPTLLIQFQCTPIPVSFSTSPRSPPLPGPLILWPSLPRAPQPIPVSSSLLTPSFYLCC